MKKIILIIALIAFVGCKEETPTENIINIKGVNIGSMIEIYNPIGKLIISKIVNHNELSIDVGNYPRGSYIIKIISIHNEFIEKFILK